MKRYTKLRNIGIIAHVDAGKTTVTERMLYYSGLIHKLGNVDQGNTVTDSDPQEAKRGITISSSAISTSWNFKEEPYQINIIDTPGHVDFAVEVERSLRVLDGVVAIFCGSSGVQPQSETVWMQSNKYGIPKLGFINKMDRIGADFFKVMKQIENVFGAITLPIQIPIGSGDEFEGVIDLIGVKAMYWNVEDKGSSWKTEKIPIDLMEQASEYRTLLLDRIAENDDEFMIQYLEEKPIEIQAVNAAVRRIALQGKGVPLLCGSAFKNIGVQPLLDSVTLFLPTPQDVNEVTGIHPVSNEKISRKRSESALFSALVFKVVADKFVGSFAMVRIYSGVINPGTFLTNHRLGTKMRVSRIIRMQADKMTEMDKGVAGDICALVGIKDVTTGDTLSVPEAPFVLEAIRFAEPVISVAIEPKSKKDYKLLGESLSKLVGEDPSLKVKIDPETGQTILSGMGELHLEVRLEKLRSEYGVEVNNGKPKVSYREEFTSTITHRELLKKQTGGSGQYADISFEIGPRTDGEKGLLFIDQIKGGVISKEFISEVRKGFSEALKQGVLLGYPMEGVQVTLYDGSIHTEDSNAKDFRNVAIMGFKSAGIKANPILMEPVMLAEISCPEDYLGNITSDVNRRRGVIQEIKNIGARQIVLAEVPLAKTFGYISDVRTLTSGRGSVNLTMLEYRSVPTSEMDMLIN